MRHSLTAVIAASLLASGCSAAPMLGIAGARPAGAKLAAKSIGGNQRFSPRHLIVERGAGAVTPVAGARVANRFGNFELHQLPAGLSVEEAIAAYERQPGVASLERLVQETDPAPEPPPAVVAPPKSAAPNLAANDQLYFMQYSHAVARVPKAWQVTKGRPDVVVAVIDTGVDYTHPDLQGQVINGPSLGDGGDDSMETSSHGTHVAGIIAAKANNGIGVAGVAPECKVLALRHTWPLMGPDGKFQEWTSDDFVVAKAIHYAATQPTVRVINLSQSLQPGPMTGNVLQFARQRGVVICTSAGNQGNNAYTGNNKRLGDAKYQDGLMVVHATDAGDRLATFSNFGSTLAISAPGADIMSTMPAGPNPISGEVNADDPYEMLSGTSMASPFVAGVSALVFSALMDKLAPVIKSKYNADLKPSMLPGHVVEDILRTSAADLGRRGRDEQFGAGRVDAASAVGLATDKIWLERAETELLELSRRR